MQNNMGISAQNLSVTFAGAKPTLALNNVNLDVTKGSLYALLGPNGAGKTTLMRCLAGILKPSQGSVALLGETPTYTDSRKYLHKLGVLIESPGLYSKLNAKEYLSFFGSFYAIKNLNQRIEKLADEFDLELSSKPIAKLSQGNKQKLQLLRSVLHEPEILLWDEPTDHLDPLAQEKIFAFLKNQMDHKNVTVLLATHRLEQIDILASHFGFIRHGQLILSESKTTLLQSGTEKVEIEFAEPYDLERAKNFCMGLNFQVAPCSVQNCSAKILNVSGKDLLFRLPELITRLCGEGFLLYRVEPQSTALAEIYAKVYADGE